MSLSAETVDVYLEIGRTRTFAAALDWPGWCRSGGDEASALQALYEYGPRYAHVLQPSRLGYRNPASPSAFVVVGRQTGNATTDFGAPNLTWPDETRPVEADELKRMGAVLQACWLAFDAAVQAAAGKTLRKGPRGGGRDLSRIAEHVHGADLGYLTSLGGKLKQVDQEDSGQLLEQSRQAILTTLAAAARGETPKHGPRGGVRWTPRYFVRRLAWHVLDHAWEIEDRAG